MSPRKVDYLNIGLILISAILAFVFPLGLFIFAFVILGPLHYFTEINWLDQKKYFTITKSRIWFWIGLGATCLIMFPKFYFYLAKSDSGSLHQFITSFNSWTNGIIFLSLILALGLVIIRKRIYWMILLLPSIGIAYYLNTNLVYNQLLGILIPTVIHVYIFTLIFMAYGAKKSKSTPGFIAVAVALVVPLLIMGATLDEGSYLFSDWTKEIYLAGNFHVSPVLTASFMGIHDGKNFFFYETVSMKMMIFFSFIYMYHYLNWFSKTSLIQWHKTLTWKRSFLIVGFWALLLFVFYLDLRLGLLFAAFFSFLHVILEFPLNVKSIDGLFRR